ncbi:YciI family protein [Variovorax dokdonensis]|uniref:YciI family protein n=1 Tax=Variovorax dokdonensis TaxID=344883 RepID=A0ABT7N546_9BURK|nr:YciI family protein [Variovorax dokdonensis]MDM0043063.1 YciI family protein [Variovorax dokdonensis]
MRYLCLIHCSDAQMADGVPPEEFASFVNAHLDYDDALRASGQLVATEALESAHSASIVRVRQGKLWVTDGPFAETSEQLGGFYLIDAASEEDAVRIAAGIPSARVGSIELRPVAHQKAVP